MAGRDCSSFLRILMSTGAAVCIAAPAIAEEADQSHAGRLSEVLVTGRRLSEETSTATRLPVPVQDIPQSIQVVSKELIENRGITRLSETLETVSGVLEEQGYSNNGSTFFNIRGFSTSNTLRDGFFTQGYAAPRDIQAIERIEVVKGPSGVLYGASGSVGGYINTVSKLPDGVRRTTAQMTAGSFGLVRPTLDWTQPWSDRFSTRLNLAYEDNDTFRDRTHYRSFSIAPSARAQLGPATTLTVVGEYTEFKSDNYDFGIPNLPLNLDPRRYYGLDSDFNRSEALAGTVTLEHKLSSDWTLRVAGYASSSSQYSTSSFIDPFSYVPGETTLDVYTYPEFDEDYDDHSARAEVSGRLTTGGITHQVLAGFEWNQRKTYYAGGDDPDYFVLDLFDESFVSPITPDVFPATLPTHISSEASAGYIQDLIDFGSGLKVLGGLRYDSITSKRGANSIDNSAWSPRIGVVYQPRPTTSLYAGYSRSFLPVLGRSASNEPFKPEKAEQIEVGVKQDLIPNRLSATLAVFELTRSGVLTIDPDNPLFRVQTGEQRSRGVEFDLTGSPAPGWTVAGSFTYLDAEVTDDNSLPVGDGLQDAPDTSASLWSSYEFQEGALRGFGLGAGVFYVGAREATLPNTFRLDEYVRLDAAAYWRHQNWRVQVNLRNAFDEDYGLGSSVGTFGYTVMPGRPRSVQASIAYTF